MKLREILSAVVILLAALPAMAQTAGPVGDAIGQLLAQSGLSGGLIVHAGCDDGLLPAMLAERDSFLVHGLVRDPGRLDAVAQRSENRGSVAGYRRSRGTAEACRTPTGRSTCCLSRTRVAA